ncbi:MAG TPA: biosynthetic arginine decarboxylase [Thermoanaerobaculia bacterium]|nr:biosynthetic arginine decarboxylase [Thermoanaerobaculia bacterium]
MNGPTTEREAETMKRGASATPGWTVEKSSDLYEIENWGKGYFSIGENGSVLVHPRRSPDRAVDLERLVSDLSLRGIAVPVLVRFGDILRDRIEAIHQAFDLAIEQTGYQGGYRSVYPIKVNQQRHVVEEIQRWGKPFGDGLEAGSKPELLAVLAIADNDTPIICNGFKDDEYIETVLLAQKVGRQITPVVEKFSELALILNYARQLDLRPSIGLRVKLATRGSGRWKDSAGYRSKFGLTVTESLAALERLHAEGMADCLRLLHFHLGSQITNIRQIKEATREAAQVYCELSRLGAGLRILDVGGGLGVDYDGSQTNFESSINYTLQEYANDIVHHVHAVCEEAGVGHPDLITECGRALTAYHSVLIFDVLGVSGYGDAPIPEKIPEDAEQPLVDLFDSYRELSAKNLIEAYHDIQAALDESLNLFKLGYMSIEQRAMAETLYWATCRRLQQMTNDLDEIPEELQGLDAQLAESYFGNFSLFQSVPDSWAIRQLFPILPIHRHREEPRRRGILCDISCDSDGKIDRFIDRRDVKRTLPLHAANGQPYYLGVFLVGAYQEILGDLHNLFGDTNAVHVRLDEQGSVVFEEVVRGDSVREVLAYVQFDADMLLRRFRRDVETAVREGRLAADESGRLLRFYEDGLRGYTYLE